MRHGDSVTKPDYYYLLLLLLYYYYRAKRAAKLAIFNAKNAERLKFCEELEDVDRKGNVFRVAKQLVRKNRDVVRCGMCEG